MELSYVESITDYNKVRIDHSKNRNLDQILVDNIFIHIYRERDDEMDRRNGPVEIKINK